MKKQLGNLRQDLPYKGQSGGGGSKVNGRCPRCGAGYGSYVFMGRYKACKHCGYDRREERILEYARHQDKHGRPVDPETTKRVLAYHDRVYENKKSG